jgi:hypothetical protein
MKDSTRDALEGIDFYLRNPEPPTRDTLFQRLADAWAGRRDRLSAAQTAKSTPDVPLPELTPWAHDTLALAAQVEAKERTVHEGSIDPARREITRLAHTAATARTAAATATTAAEQAEEKGPDSPEPVSAAEAYDSEAVRIGRRANAHNTRLASHHARATAANDTAATAAADLALLETRIEGADKALAHRLSEHAHYTRRRLAVYARAITRRHPDAAIITALTTALAGPAHTTATDPGGQPPFLHAL